MRPTLCVCLITQDQAVRLPPLLDQASRVADEIVVVDGGSRDATAAVVARYPLARLVHRPFDGNFAAQKNAALDAARSEWILFLDTDELLGPNLERLLPSLLRSPFRSFSFPRCWLARTEPLLHVELGANLPDRVYRLFRNRPGIRYDPVRPVHEGMLRELLRPRLRVRYSHVLHYCLLWEDRASRERKVWRYGSAGPGETDVNRVYLFEDHPHRLVSCREGWVDGRPIVASAWDLTRDRLLLALKSPLAAIARSGNGAHR